MDKAKTYNFVVNEKHENNRADIFLVESLRNLGETVSRNLIAKYKKNILINSLNKKPSTKVKTGDQVSFTIPPPKKIELTPQEVDFEIVYEDNDIIVINKPPGLVVHPAKGNYDKTLVHGILNKIDDLGSFNNVLRPGVVHRLDKDTSGLIIVAKNIKSHQVLSKMFKKREIKKIYWAIVSSSKLKSKGKIDKPIARHKVYRKKFTVSEQGKKALTHYKVLTKNQTHSLVEIDLKTGRTHQIRVHFSSIGAPVAGDKIYSKKWNKYKNKGLALVAKKLEFHHPIDCRLLKFEVNLPKHFVSIMEEIKIKL